MKTGREIVSALGYPKMIRHCALLLLPRSDQVPAVWSSLRTAMASTRHRIWTGWQRRMPWRTGSAHQDLHTKPGEDHSTVHTRSIAKYRRRDTQDTVARHGQGLGEDEAHWQGHRLSQGWKPANISPVLDTPGHHRRGFRSTRHERWGTGPWVGQCYNKPASDNIIRDMTFRLKQLMVYIGEEPCHPVRVSGPMAGKA